jgi:hypothetical protein
MFIKAKPIFLKDKNKRPNTFAVFSKKITVDKTNDLMIRITACSYYRLRINGEFVCHGPARSGHGTARVDEYSLDGFIKAGENLIETETACYFGTFGTVNEDTGEPAFVIAEIYQNGRIICFTDTDWEGREVYQRDRYAQRHSHCRQITEVWHLDENYPSPAALPRGEVEAVPCPRFIPRGVPYPEYQHIKANFLIETGACAYDTEKPLHTTFFDRWNEEYAMQGERPGAEDLRLERKPLDCAVKKRGGAVSFGEGAGFKYASYDLKSMYVGFIEFSVTLAEASCVDIIYGERVEDDGDISSQPAHNTCFRVYCPAGKTSFTSFEPYACRYVKAVVKTEKPFEINGVGVLTYVTPDTRGGTFLCSDENVNAIYEAAYKTLLLNTLDIFMDCPDRERGGWLCDSLWTGRAAALMLADPSVERAMIENFVCVPADECFYGFFPQCYPAAGDFRHGALTTWSFWLIAEIREYYNRTGDRELLDKMKPRIDGFFDGVQKLCGEHGLFESKSTVFVDWSQSNNRENVYPVSCAANAIYAYALLSYDELYGVPEAKEHAEKIRKTLKEKAIDGGVYDPRYILRDSLDIKDGKLVGKPYFTEAAQYTMLWADLFTKEECPKLTETVVNELGPCPRVRPMSLDIGAANMFIGLCIRLDMLSKLGYKEVMFEEIKHLCGYMLKEGPGTLWETVSGKSSRCHGFMAHIGVLLSRDILGLDIPQTVPEKYVNIAPNPCGLRFAEGTVDTPDGVISVSWHKGEGEFELNVSAPASYKLNITLPPEIRGYDTVTVNGERIKERKYAFPAQTSPVFIKAETK